jgi:kumamolisin
MAFNNRITLRGSEKKPVPNAEPVGAIAPDDQIRVTVFLRRKSADPVPAPGPHGTHLSREEFAQQHGATPEDIALVERFAHEYQITVADTNIGKRRVILTGTAANVTKAFGTELACYKLPSTGHTFRGRTGTISIPTELDGVVVAVVGLDTRPIAKPHFRRKKRQTQPTTFTPPQVAALYNYPTGVTGTGQTVAIIELGGGYTTSDLQTYFRSLGITEPNVTAVSVDGGTNSPGSDADGEVMLDIEVVGAIAPGVNIAVYFAPNTDQGFLDAITDAVHDTTRKPSVVSVSWGGPESSWTQQSLTAMNGALQDAATLGVTVTVAAGDNGSSDGVTDGQLHVDFPASSPYALACGGTTLTGSGNKISSEVVWNETANNEGATGGGVSGSFPRPTYQSSAGVPAQPQTKYVGRGVPDVAGDADPSTGYQIRVDGQNTVVGGTSAVAPLWAALVALINEQIGKNSGFLNPTLYSLGEADFHDITSGNNDDSGLGYYSAGPGWDPCTGLGSPNGSALLQAIGGGSSASRRVPIPGSAPKHASSDQLTNLPDPGKELVTASIILRSAPASGAADAGQRLLAGDQNVPAASTMADPNEMAAVCSFAQHYGLTLLDEDFESRRVKVQGTAQQMNEAFGIELCRCTNRSGHECLSYMGAITVPGSISQYITAVLGLDQRPVARHHGVVPPNVSKAETRAAAASSSGGESTSTDPGTRE